MLTGVTNANWSAETAELMRPRFRVVLNGVAVDATLPNLQAFMASMLQRIKVSQGSHGWGAVVVWRSVVCGIGYHGELCWEQLKGMSDQLGAHPQTPPRLYPTLPVPRAHACRRRTRTHGPSGSR